VESSNEALRKLVETVLDMALSTVSSLNDLFLSGEPLADEEPEKDVVVAASGYQWTRRRM